MFLITSVNLHLMQTAMVTRITIATGSNMKRRVGAGLEVTVEIGCC